MGCARKEHYSHSRRRAVIRSSDFGETITTTTGPSCRRRCLWVGSSIALPALPAGTGSSVKPSQPNNSSSAPAVVIKLSHHRPLEVQKVNITKVCAAGQLAAIKLAIPHQRQLTEKFGIAPIPPPQIGGPLSHFQRAQRHVWKSLPGFLDRDWNDLRDDLYAEYVSPSTEGQFSKQKLLDFANKYAHERMNDEPDVIHHHRQFNNLAKILVDSGRITKGERNAIFWRGFHPDDQQALREHLIAKQPDKPKGQAFDLKYVLKSTRAIF